VNAELVTCFAVCFSRNPKNIYIKIQLNSPLPVVISKLFPNKGNSLLNFSLPELQISFFHHFIFSTPRLSEGRLGNDLGLHSKNSVLLPLSAHHNPSTLSLTLFLSLFLSLFLPIYLLLYFWRSIKNILSVNALLCYF
jgi:hypothetical protein